MGNGTLFLGVIKALEHFLASGILSPTALPRIFAVQSENCAVVPSATLAEGIAIGRPMRGEEILRYLYRFGGRVVPVPEEGILPAREALAQKGIFCEHTTAATYAAYQKYIRENGRLEDVLLPICGAGLKSEK